MKTAMKSTLWVALAALLWSPSALEAQRTPGGDRQMNREQMQERVQRTFEERMARALELTEDQQARMREVLAEYREARRELMPRRMELQRETRRFTTAVRAGDEEVEALARELLQARRSLRESELRLQQDEEERLLQILSPGQVLRMQMLREEFGARIRTLEGGPRAGMARRGPAALRGGPAWGAPRWQGPGPRRPRARGPGSGGPGDR